MTISLERVLGKDVKIGEPKTAIAGFVATGFYDRQMNPMKIVDYIKYANLILEVDRKDDLLARLPVGHSYEETFLTYYPETAESKLVDSYEEKIDITLKKHGIVPNEHLRKMFLANASIGHIWSRGDVTTIPEEYYDNLLRIEVNGKVLGLPARDSVRKLETLEPDELYTTLRVAEGFWYIRGMQSVLCNEDNINDFATRHLSLAIEAMQVFSDLRHKKNPNEPTFNQIIGSIRERDKTHSSLQEILHLAKVYGVPAWEGIAMWSLMGIITSRHEKAEWDRK